MLFTRGNDWLLDAPEHAKRWCKLIADKSEIDLNQGGGYAIQSSFVAGHTEIGLEVGHYLFIANEIGPTIGDRKNYNIKLLTVTSVSGKEVLTEVTKTEIYSTSYRGMKIPECVDLIPRERRQRVLNNYQYLIAVYLTFVLSGVLPAVAADPATKTADARMPGRRFIERLDGQPVVQLSAAEPPAAAVRRLHGLDDRPPPRTRR